LVDKSDAIIDKYSKVYNTPEGREMVYDIVKAELYAGDPHS
jgi:hypothetical protein